MEAEGYIDNGGYREDTEHNHKKSQTWAGGRVQGQVHWSKQGKGTHMAQMDMGQGRTQRSIRTTVWTLPPPLPQRPYFFWSPALLN